MVAETSNLKYYLLLVLDSEYMQPSLTWTKLTHLYKIRVRTYELYSLSGSIVCDHINSTNDCSTEWQQEDSNCVV